MHIYIASDHAGFKLKKELIPFVESLGYEVEDCGAHTYDAKDDYPDFVSKVAKKISEKPDEIRGIVIGGSGQGEAMVSNRFKNVRAAVYYGGNKEIVTLSREHNDANILSLSARFVDYEEAQEVVKLWLETPFKDEERHIRRINKID